MSKSMSVISVIEADAEKVLSFLNGAEKKVSAVGPNVIAGLGVILGKFAAVAADASGDAAAGGLNIALDVQTVTDIKAVWPALVQFAASIGIKL